MNLGTPELIIIVIILIPILIVAILGIRWSLRKKSK